MGNINADIEAQLGMIMNNYETLQKKNPEHELLKLAAVHEDKGGFDWAKEFWKKCSKDGERTMHGYMRYHSFLKNAISGVPYHFVDDPAFNAIENLIKQLKLRNPGESSSPIRKKNIEEKIKNALDSGATWDELTITLDQNTIGFEYEIYIGILKKVIDSK